MSAEGRYLVNSINWDDGTAGTNTLVSLTADSNGVLTCGSNTSANTSVLISNVRDPVSPQDAATKLYVDSNGGNLKDPSLVATTGSGDMSTSTYDETGSGNLGTITWATNPGTIDGINVAVGNRILVKDDAAAGTDATQSQGIYIVITDGATLVANRVADLSNGSSAFGAATFIVSGTVNGNKTFTQTDDVTVGTGNLSWTESGTDAAGIDTEIQFNDGGVLGANASFTFTKSATAPAMSIGSATTTTSTTLNVGTGDTVATVTENHGAGTGTDTSTTINFADGNGNTSLDAQGTGTFILQSSAGPVELKSTFASSTLSISTADGAAVGGEIDIAAGNGTTTGGALTLNAGVGATNGDGGALTLNAGVAGVISADGGDVIVSAGTGGSTSGLGGSIGIDAGDATSGAAGIISINAGDATSGAAGTTSITSGDSGDAAGGILSLQSGSGGGALAGGEIDLTAGAGGLTGTGGAIDLNAGSGGATSGDGGALTLNAGSATSGSGGALTVATGAGAGNGDGGILTLTASSGAGTGNGGNVDINAGAGDTPGDVTIDAGLATLDSQKGGNVTITAGTGGATAGLGGDLTLNAGSGTGADIGVVTIGGNVTASNGQVIIGGGTTGSNTNSITHYYVDQAYLEDAGTAATSLVNKGYVDNAVGGAAAGTTNDIQFNNADAFAADTGVFTYNAATDTFSVASLSGVIQTGGGNGTGTVKGIDGAAGETGSNLSIGGGAGGSTVGDNGGAVTVVGGLGEATQGDGGDVTISGAVGGTTSGKSGDIIIGGGDTVGSGTGGDITLTSGTSTGGVAGDIIVDSKKDLNMDSVGSVTLNSGAYLNTVVAFSIDIDAGAAIAIDSTSNMTLTSGTILALNSTSSLNLTSSSDMNLTSFTDLNLISTIGNIVVASADKTPALSDLTGTNFRVAPQTITAAGAENYAFSAFAQPAISGSTTGTASTVYIENAPTGTAVAYALNVASGVTCLQGVVEIGDGTTSTINSAGSATTVNLFNDDTLTTANICGGINVGTLNIGTGMTTGIINMGASGTTTEIVYPRTDFSTAGSTAMVNKGYVDSVASGITWKDAAVAATVAGDMTASTYAVSGGGDGLDTITWVGVPTIDGVTVANGDRILVKNNAATTGTNSQGIYEVTTDTTNLVLTRTADALGAGGPALLASGAAIFAYEGTDNNDKGFVCTTDGTIDFGVAISFSVFTATGGAAGVEDSIQFNTAGNFTGVNSLLFIDTVATTPELKIGTDILSTTATLNIGADGGVATAGILKMSDGASISLIQHLGTGQMQFDNTSTTANTTMILGEDLGVTYFEVENSSGATQVSVSSIGNMFMLGDLDVRGGDIQNSTGALNIDSAGAMTSTATGGDLTLATATSGGIVVNAVNVDISGSDLTGTILEVQTQQITVTGAEDAVGTGFAVPTISGTTSGDVATVYIAGNPTGGVVGNTYALWVDSGDVQIDGNLTVDGTITGTVVATLTEFNLFVGNSAAESIVTGNSLTFDNTTAATVPVLAIGNAATNDGSTFSMSDVAGTGKSTMLMNGTTEALIDATESDLRIDAAGTMTLISTGNAGDIVATAGISTTATVAGGDVALTGGVGNTTGTGGDITLTGGDSGSTDNAVGGAVSLVGGTSTATNGLGGDVTLTSGAGTGTGAAGDIVLLPSTGGTGTDGIVDIVGTTTYMKLNSTIQGTAGGAATGTGSIVSDGGASFAKKVYGLSFHSTSDIRMKSNIEPLMDPLSTIRKIEGYSYNWKENDDNTRHYGVLAQQMEAVGLGDFVSGDGSAQKAVDYMGLIPFLIGAVKELSDKVETLESQFD
jgi:hypothetical protein